MGISRQRANRLRSWRRKLRPADKKDLILDPERDAAFDLCYVGQWEREQMHGFGRYFFAPDSCYVGEWRYGLRHGLGTLFYAPGTARESLLGPEVRDAPPTVEVRAGAAQLRRAPRPYGALYAGLFDADARSGEGCVIFQNGDVFRGTFAANAAEGEGVLYCVERHTRQAGLFRAGACGCSAVSAEWGFFDYEAVFTSWAHPCGGFAGLPAPVYRALAAKFPTEWPDHFRTPDDMYPYAHRPPGGDAEATRIIATDSAEAIAHCLPLRMRPAQTELQQILHTPLEDHGRTIPPSLLVDPDAVLQAGMQ